VYFSVDATPAGGAGSGAASADEAGAADILGGSAPNGVARVDPRSAVAVAVAVAVRAGRRITFAVDPARLHFFDPDTGGTVS
jgi:hypothetical protein